MHGYGATSCVQDVKKTRVINGVSSKNIGHVDSRKAPDVSLTTVSSIPAGRIEEGTSLLNSFTPSQIHAHLQSLKTGLRLTAAKIRQKCAPVLKKLTDHECSWIFMQPVDPVELNLPDYFDIIKTPMDLGSIKKRMENNCYKSISEFGADVRLTFDNAVSYNGDGSDVCKVAREMKAAFEKLYQAMIASIEAEEEHRKSSGDVCVLCGCEKLLFEPTVYYCNGSCNGQRIRRNSYYYTGGRNQYHWCQQCFNELREKEPLEFADCTLWKKELQKKKNDEMHEEPWVECSQCNRWVHQICALFNGRMNKGTTIYHCPFCFMARRGAREPHAKPLGAKEIRHTKLSRFLEDRVIKSLEDAYARNATSTGRSMVPNEKAPAIYVRQLSNIEKMHQVKPRILQRYTDQNYPREFPVRSKCILLFQEMDGVDVILFGMYLYEYGHNCPQPNQRRVYVSYLDSVYYFRPRQYRTLVYHEMLIAYLAHIKERGFHTAHIWACPPCKGDDYIFFCHPEDQKTPKDDRLRSWYITLLEKAKEEGVVTRITNLWDEHFKADLDVTHVPYFEGDYWPGEAENVVKALEDEANERIESKSRKTSSVAKSKAKKKGRTQRGLRSDGSIIEENGQDALVARMGKILEPMKDAFIVAYLQPRNFALVMEDRYEKEQSLDVSTRKEDLTAPVVPNNEKVPTGNTVNMKSTSADPSSTDTKSSRPAHATKLDATSTPEMHKKNENTPIEEGESPRPTNKLDGDKNICKSMNKVDSKASKPFDETEDTDEIIESEFYDTRQQFLNLCQGNHYQFDDLRRAKHTSMMSLYHMHNPDVPKFLVTCSNCNVDINSGFCYTSEKDTEFHLCQDCYQKMHKIFSDKFPFRRSVVGSDSQAQLTEEQRRDRHRSIQLHMQLLQHASGCRNQQCPSANCNKMKVTLTYLILFTPFTPMTRRIF
jgi:E1A/CREB-binding protein